MSLFCAKSVSEHIYSLSGVKHTTKKNHEKLSISGRANFYGQPDCKISVFLQLLLPLSWIPIKWFVEEGGHATFCVEGSLNRALGVEEL